MSRLIPLTRGQHTIVDDEDFDWLTQWKWQAKWNTCTRSFYAVHSIKTGKGVTKFAMHRIIMEPLKGFEVDHVNNNTLDNRRKNLRICTKGENQRNRRGPTLKNGSGFLGVSWNKEKRKWVAQIRVDHCSHYLGCFDSKEEAARIRDAAAKKLHGKFARLNGT
jgi:HNH endonuclease